MIEAVNCLPGKESRIHVYMKDYITQTYVPLLFLYYTNLRSVFQVGISSCNLFLLSFRLILHSPFSLCCLSPMTLRAAHYWAALPRFTLFVFTTVSFPNDLLLKCFDILPASSLLLSFNSYNISNSKTNTNKKKKKYNSSYRPH